MNVPAGFLTGTDDLGDLLHLALADQLCRPLLVRVVEALQQARDIMDELSQKFGIPIIISPGKEPGVDWYEWKKRQDHQSWKQQMRLDIKQASKMAHTPEEFKKYLTAIGYKIRETENHYTYTMPDTDEHGPGCSCRDSRLNCAGDPFY